VYAGLIHQLSVRSVFAGIMARALCGGRGAAGLADVVVMFVCSLTGN
jgi:hypothetical protein